MRMGRYPFLRRFGGRTGHHGIFSPRRHVLQPPDRSAMSVGEGTVPDPDGESTLPADDRSDAVSGPAMSKPTIRNVAERAGVSKSLVSLVMRGSPHVSDRRRKAVLKAARELGYRPNAVARSLVEGRTRLIGAIVADLHNPFFAEFLDGLQETLHGEGLRMLVGSGRWDPLFEAEAVEAFLEMRVDGLVLLSVVPDSLKEAAASV